MNLKSYLFFNFTIKLLKTFPFTVKCTSHGENCYLYKLILEIVTGISDLICESVCCTL